MLLAWRTRSEAELANRDFHDEPEKRVERLHRMFGFRKRGQVSSYNGLAECERRARGACGEPRRSFS
jgi:hypothetical protein